MEYANKRRQIFLSLSKLEWGLQEINSREIRLHLTFSEIGINSTEFQKKRIHFNSGIFAAVAIAADDAKAPY